MIKYTKYIVILALSLFLFNCESEQDTADINNDTPEAFGFIAETATFGASVDDPIYGLKVVSTTKSSSDRSFSVTLNEDSTGIPSDYDMSSMTVVIPAGAYEGKTDITFFLDELDFGDEKTLIFDLVLGQGDMPINNTQKIELTYFKACTLNSVQLDFVFDDYPEEIYWAIEDASATVVAESMTPAAWGAYDGLEGELSINLCLADGTYTFTIYDQYGDGICCAYGNGSYSLSGGGNVYASGGSYGGSESTTFTLGN